MNQRSFCAAVSAVIYMLCFGSGLAVAWNPSGHMIVALVAYDTMDEASRAEAIELLRAHPRFHDHFERYMPREIERGSKEDQDRWIFAHASTWSDIVRRSNNRVSRQDVDNFNRPWWHFIDEPVYLSDAEQRELEHHLPVNLKRDPPPGNDDDRNMNVIQAVKNSSRIVKDKNAPKEKRAVHLCWLLHLVGDAHQPLHSSTLFTTHRFREDDHGGNNLEVSDGNTLHGFWDDQISTDEPYETISILAVDLEQNPELAAAGAAAAAKSLDIGDWIDEGHELAKLYVYTPEVLGKVAAREKHSHLGELHLTPGYEADAENVSERRAAEAGHRLAGLLNELLP